MAAGQSIRNTGLLSIRFVANRNVASRNVASRNVANKNVAFRNVYTIAINNTLT